MVKIINDAIFKEKNILSGWPHFAKLKLWDSCIFGRGFDAGKINKNYTMCYVTQLQIKWCSELWNNKGFQKNMRWVAAM